ncbi:MAG: 1-acyl-sn-glycerol-3-phosphate acyltransferase [Myxococcota bacterium]
MATSASTPPSAPLSDAPASADVPLRPAAAELSVVPEPPPGPGAAGDERPKYRPNALLRWIYRRFFSHLRVDDTWKEHVRASAARGTVVYVMRSMSVLDFLCLDFLTKRFELPLPRFVSDLGIGVLEPFYKGRNRLLRRQPPDPELLREVTGEGYASLLFLRRPPRTVRRTARGKGSALRDDLLRALVAQQRTQERAILLVPQTFVWSKRPPEKKKGLLDLFFGPVDWPGRIRVFFQFLGNYRNALLRVGEPFDLRAFLAEHPGLGEVEAANKVRFALLARMERERRLVLGPSTKTTARIQDELLRSPRVREALESVARKKKRSVSRVERDARKQLRKLQADQRQGMLALLERVLDFVFGRIYDGIVVDERGIERVRQAAREHTLIYLPSHKSHVDYLVLSYVLYKRALAAPLIAAGDNLSFWPVGWFLRRGGAFFIRRSFRGDKLYPALVDAYLRKLIVEGFPIEFFIEGGRSRTGKLRPPQYGLLSMVIDAALKLPLKKVAFVPISIGYERVVEERSYVRELGGGEKQRESAIGLLRTGDVLRKKYGRLYVQFGAVMSFDRLLERTLTADDGTLRTREELSPGQRRTLVQNLAHRVTYQIDRVTVVTPAALVATALLVHRRRGIGQHTLYGRASQLLASLERFGARIASPIQGPEGKLRPETLEEAVALFVDGGLVRRHEPSAKDADDAIYRVPDQRRIALEYSMSSVLHFFVPSALIAAALLAEEERTLSVHALRERVRGLSRLFKYEFMYRADAPFETIFGDALGGMLEARELERIADHVRPAEGGRGKAIATYAAMLRSYFEAYFLAARALRPVLEDGEAQPTRKEWLKQALALGQRMYLAGELELRESVSKPKLDNALRAFKDHGLVRFEAGETFRRAKGIEGADPLGPVETQLRRFLE